MQVPTHTHADVPQGAPFSIDPLPFVPGEHLDIEQLTMPEDRAKDWPVVYILTNDEEAYVGQTTSVATRADQHGANEEKKAFEQITIIFNEEFNTSVTTDYEARLIDLMYADEHFRLTNKVHGITRSNYFSKDAYSSMFDDLWEQLRSDKYRLAFGSIEDIQEREIFKLSPFKALTPDQKIALDEIQLAIEDAFPDGHRTADDSAHAIVVEGMPGTGKTILAIFLLKKLKEDPKYQGLNIKLLEPVGSLHDTLRRVLPSAGLDASDVIGPSDLDSPACGFRHGKKGNIDILLVDEAHKLKRRVAIQDHKTHLRVNANLGLGRDATQMDWVMNQARLPIFFYDPLQAIGPNCVKPESIEKALGIAVKNPITLETQMRVKAGGEYLEYISDILGARHPDPIDFDEYDFVLHEDFGDFLDSFEADHQKHSLTRMVAGFAWPWATSPRKKLRPGQERPWFDIEIDDIKLRWNRTNRDWVGKGLNDEGIAHEVGCVHSTQGYDLSHAYVIIGKDIKLDKATGKLVCDKRNYYDTKGKETATQEELDGFVRNIYYILLTRGIFATHVYVVDDELREYLAPYFPQVV